MGVPETYAVSPKMGLVPPASRPVRKRCIRKSPSSPAHLMSW